MGTAFEPARYRGIIRPDPNLELWADETGVFDAGGSKLGEIGQASPIAGIAEPDQVTDLALRASGEQTEDLDVYCNRAGLPILDEVGVLWRKDGQAAALYRGRDLPVPAAGWQPFDVTNSRLYRHCVTLPDDHIVVCYQDSSGVTYSRTYDPDLLTWGGEVTVDSATETQAYPCLVVIPRVDGYRLILYRWGTNGADYQIRQFYSDDQGATWENGGFVLETDVTASTISNRRRIRGAYLNGQVLLVGHVQNTATGEVSRDRIIQWASSDGGMTFTQVTYSDGSDWDNAGAWVDVTTWRGEFVLGRLIYDATSATPAFRRLASAWYPWTAGSDDSAPGTGLTSAQHWGLYINPGAGVDTYISEGELALVIADDFAMYALGRHCAGGDNGGHPVIRSADGADSWAVMGQHPAYAGSGSMWWNPADVGVSVATTNELWGHTACYQRGRVCVLTSWRRSAVGGVTNFTGAIWLGGWQTVPMPSLVDSMLPERRTAWDYTGCGMFLPSESIYATALVGGATETLAAGRVVHTTGVGLPTSVTSTYVPTATVAEGAIGEWALEFGTATGTVNIEMRFSDNTPQMYHVRVIVTHLSIQLYDVNAGGNIGSAYNYTSQEPIRIRLAMEGDDVKCWARTGTTALPTTDDWAYEDRAWDIVAQTGTLTVSATNPGNLISFATTLANATVYWDEYHIVCGAYTGIGLYSQPERRKYPGCLIESPSWAGYGLSMSAVTGPSMQGDTWSIEATADYPYDAALPTTSPSPRHPWRSTDYVAEPATADNVRISWQRASADESGESYVWGVLLDGLNMGGVEVYLYYGGAWNLAASVGYWTGTFAKTTDVLTLTSGGALNTAVLRRGELAGCMIEEVSGASSVARTVCMSNTPGHMDTTAGTSLPLRIRVDDASSFTATPSVRIYPRRALLILDLDSLDIDFRAVQIRFPFSLPAVGSPTAPGWPSDGYAEIATVAAGPLWPWGTTHSWGYRLATEQDVELVTAEDGTRMAWERSPIRRRWALSWSDPVSDHDMTDVDPDYIIGKPAGDPLAFKRTTPNDLADQLRALSGSLTPVVYAPAIDSGGSGRADHWADGAMVCRITSAVEKDNVVGDEERSEASRVQELVLEEEV